MANKLSVREIARRLGVSPSTVSRVLNHTGTISKETSDLVYRTIKELGYDLPEDMPDNDIIAIIHPHIGISLMTDIEKYLEIDLKGKGFDLIYIPYSASGKDTKSSDILKAVNLALNFGVKAILLFTEDGNIKLPDTKTPVLTFNLEQSEQFSSKYMISYDFVVGSKLAAEELLRKGCSKPIILYNSHYTPGNDSRYKGFIESFEEAGYPISNDRRIYSDGTRKSFDDARDHICYLIAKGLEFDSIYCGSDWRAFGALSALHDLGIKVPEQVRVIGFDGSDIAQNNDPPITSVYTSSRSAAIRITDILLNLINKKEADKVTIIPAQLFTGQTT
ncbi:MAG: LacI family DNA-binding transcriptional regulator [Erysipelotrichaceae bacterium]|nr:LacI family DNA-binding transcriptional regulator [Erysipelotrichaceae bacterium]